MFYDSNNFEIEPVDIGFSGAHFYIQTPLKGDDPNIQMSFQLCSTTTDACLPITDCWYTQDSLKTSVDALKDPTMQADMQALLNSSTMSKQTLEAFYPALESILKSLDSTQKCKSRPLKELISKLQSDSKSI